MARACAPHRCETAARAFDQREKTVLVARAVQHPIVEMRIERRTDFTRKHAARRDIHVRPALEGGKMTARFDERDRLDGFIHGSISFS